MTKLALSLSLLHYFWLDISGSVEKEPRRNLNSSESRNLLSSTKALKFEDVLRIKFLVLLLLLSSKEKETTELDFCRT